MTEIGQLQFPEPIEKQETFEVQDPSKIQCGMECMRKYFFCHVLGWKKVEPSHDLVFGESWHRAMAAVLTHGCTQEALELGMANFLEYYRQFYDEDTDIEHSPKSPADAFMILTKYIERFGQEEEEFEVLSMENGRKLIEVHGAVPLLPQFSVHVRLDAVCKWLKGPHEGKVFVLEHKTTKRLDASWMRKWAMDMQIMTYIHTLHCVFGHDKVYGAVINGAHFKKSYKSGEHPIVRVPVWRDASAIEAWYADACFWLESILNEFNELALCNWYSPVLTAFPKNTQNCNMYWGCPYYDFCLAWANPLAHADKPPTGFKVEHWDPRKRAEEIADSVTITLEGENGEPIETE